MDQSPNADDTENWIALSCATKNVVMWLALIGIADRDHGSSLREVEAIADREETSQHGQGKARA